MPRIDRIVVLAIAALAIAACGEKTTEEIRPAREKPLVLTTFYPVTYFTERLAGDAIELVCPLPEDADPIFWQPSDAELAAFVGADLVVANGAGFERWMRIASLPESRLVASASRLDEPLIEMTGTLTHSHGGKGAHSHSGIDGHTWVDPLNAVRQIEAIRDALVRLLPDRRNDIETRANDLEADLEDLDREIREIAAEAARTGQPILASHPAYNYLARRYELAVVNLDLDPEEMPDEAAIAAIAAILKDQPARAILWESRPLPEIAARLKAELGIESFVYSPCEMLSAADRAKGENFLTVMKTNLGNLRAALALRGN